MAPAACLPAAAHRVGAVPRVAAALPAWAGSRGEAVPWVRAEFQVEVDPSAPAGFPGEVAPSAPAARPGEAAPAAAAEASVPGVF